MQQSPKIMIITLTPGTFFPKIRIDCQLLKIVMYVGKYLQTKVFVHMRKILQCCRALNYVGRL
jgi:hypothetical protein